MLVVDNDDDDVVVVLFCCPKCDYRIKCYLFFSISSSGASSTTASHTSSFNRSPTTDHQSNYGSHTTHITITIP